MKKLNTTVLIAILLFFTLTVFAVLQNSANHNVFYLMGILFSGLFLTTITALSFTKKQELDVKDTTDNTTVIENLEKDEALVQLKQEEQAKLASQRILEGISNTQNPLQFAELVLKKMAKEFNGIQGVLFIRHSNDTFISASTYAFYSESEIRKFKIGEGITGQVAKNQKLLNISNVPENYITVMSGLGKSSPGFLLILPIVYQSQTVCIIEMATFEPFPENIEQIYQLINEELAAKANQFTVKSEA